MTRLDEKIIEFVKNKGPSTPIEVASKFGTNSIIVTAVMIDACSNQKLKRTKRKVAGSMKLYYIPGQEEKMRKRISSTLTPEDKELLDKLMEEKVIGEFELEPAEKAIFSNLEDLINVSMLNHNGESLRTWHTPEIDEEKAKNIAEEKLKSTETGAEKTEKDIEKTEEKNEEKVEETKNKSEEAAEDEETKSKKDEEEEKQEKKPENKEEKTSEESKKEKKGEQKHLGELKSEFREKVLRWFEKREITVEKEKTIEEGKEYELQAKVPTPLGRQNYFVKVMDLGKRKLGRSVLEPIAMDAVGKRTPVIVISKSGFAKNARKYRDKQVDDLVKLVSQDDLE
ncbi:MAG: hypothetical protein R6U26_01335 [Candidatus Undinarchaeales archaeon]